MVALRVSCGMEGCYMERPEMRLRFVEVKPWCMMMLSDQTTLICHTLRGQAAQKPLGIGTKLFNKATALRELQRGQLAHVDKLRKMKPGIDMRSPKQYPHVQYNARWRSFGNLAGLLSANGLRATGLRGKGCG